MCKDTGVGSIYRDTLKHVLWRSVLGLLPRTVPVNTTHPSVHRKSCNPSETTNRTPYTAARVCLTLIQDRERHGSRDRDPMDGFTACPEVR